MAAASRPRLRLTRAQILAFRRATQSLDRTLPPGPASLACAAWAGLQDSMPRAALLSLHARVEGITFDGWDAPPLVQLWGPRYSAYVVMEEDAAVFTLGRMPERGATRRAAEALAAHMARTMGRERMLHGDVARALGEPPNRLKYATLTGGVRMRWDGARQVSLWMVPAPAMEARAARLELARRYLHVFGPASSAAFARWAGVPPAQAAATFAALGLELMPVRTPLGDEFALATDEALLRTPPETAPVVRLLPSGDAWFLFHRAAERALLVEEAHLRERLWTSRVWPGVVMMHGDVVGTWRRTESLVTVHPWRRLSRAERQAVDMAVASLPLTRPAGHVAAAWPVS